MKKKAKLSEKVEWVPIESVVPYARNAKKHPQEQIDKIKASIMEFGFTRPLLVDEDGVLLYGHGAREAALQLGIDKVPVLRYTGLTEAQKRAYRLADNRLAESPWDTGLLELEFQELEDLGYPLDLTGFYEDERLEVLGLKSPGRFYDDGELSDGNLKEEFLVPPFSVLDARRGYWRKRKRMWLNYTEALLDTREGVLNESALIKSINKGASVFDPVLAEVIVRWFTPPGRSVIIDPFAGGIFGLVAARLGNEFYGIELREEQQKQNQERADALGLPAKWYCDDGQNAAKYFKPDSADLLFSCPPYYNLEVYSDLPNDASNQETYSDYLKIIFNAFRASAQALKENRFACVVVGDIRDEQGSYRDLPGDIIAIFRRLGFLLYNRMVLVQVVGTASLRARGYMRVRKVAKTHDSVLVFYRGDPGKIKDIYGEVEVYIPPEEEEDEEEGD